jgi:hypothetical protein
MMARQGFKVPKPDNPETRKADQTALAAALRTLCK